MDGVTDRLFRDLVIDLGSVGGACTEFVRVTTGPMGRAVFRRELGAPRRDVPVGVQIMAPGPEFVAESAANAEAAGAPWIDLNFGCPVKRVFDKCAGAALLAHPERVGAIVAEAVAGAGVPVSAKIRAGVDDDALLDEVTDACVDAGAAAVIVHARLRRDSYAAPARWEWIAQVVERVRSRSGTCAVVGNGGIDVASDVARMLSQTGCDAVMVGRGAIADPFVFRTANGGPPPSRAEAVAFALRYLDALCPPGGGRGGLGRMKQLLRRVTAGGLFAGDDDARAALLRTSDPHVVREWLRAAAAQAPPSS